MTGSDRYSRYLDQSPASRPGRLSSRAPTARRRLESSPSRVTRWSKVLLGLVSGLRRTSTAAQPASPPNSEPASRARLLRSPELYVLTVFWTKEGDDRDQGSPLLGPVEGLTNAEKAATDLRKHFRATNHEFHRVKVSGPIREIAWLKGLKH